MSICPHCHGTGTAQYVGILSVGDGDGCLRCGGSGSLRGRQAVVRVALVLALLIGLWWLIGSPS